MKCVGAVDSLGLGFVLLLAGTPATAVMSITPAHPTTADTVKVTVGSNFNSMCWALSQPSCSQVPPDTLATIVFVDFCSGAPICACGDNPDMPRRTCLYGPLPAGTCVATYTEQHINPFDRIKTFTQIVPFTVDVAGTVPALHRTWGSLKSIYR